MGYVRKYKRARSDYKKSKKLTKYRKRSTGIYKRNVGIPGPSKPLKFCDQFGKVGMDPYDIVSAAGAYPRVVVLNVTQRGTGLSQRIGRDTSGVYLNFRGSIYATSQNTVAASRKHFAKIAIVYDRSPTGGTNALGAFPLWPMVWGQTNYAGSQSYDIWCGRNPRYLNRFQVLREWYVELPAVGVLGVASTQALAMTMPTNPNLTGTPTYVPGNTIIDNIKLSGAKSSFFDPDPANSQDITSVLEGAILIMVDTDYPLSDPSAPAYAMDFSCRYVFRDSA
jgi:hypothetical protein